MVCYFYHFYLLQCLQLPVMIIYVENQINNLAIISSLYPFSFIFLLGISLLELFPGWIRGFSNTIGMWCINLGGFKEFSYKLLKKKIIMKIEPQNIPNIILKKYIIIIFHYLMKLPVIILMPLVI